MEIHTPDAPVHSVRDFIVHLLMISVGVLIALGAEGIVEAIHHHHVVEQARSNLVAEMRSNHETLDDNLPKLKKNEQLLSQTIEDLQKLKADRKFKTRDINMNLNFFILSDSSWRTAQATGALALMNYQQAEDWAGYYDVQTLLNRTAVLAGGHLARHDGSVQSAGRRSGKDGRPPDRRDTTPHPDVAGPADRGREHRAFAE